LSAELQILLPLSSADWLVGWLFKRWPVSLTRRVGVSDVRSIRVRGFSLRVMMLPCDLRTPTFWAF